MQEPPGSHLFQTHLLHCLCLITALWSTGQLPRTFPSTTVLVHAGRTQVPCLDVWCLTSTRSSAVPSHQRTSCVVHQLVHPEYFLFLRWSSGSSVVFELPWSQSWRFLVQEGLWDLHRAAKTTLQSGLLSTSTVCYIPIQKRWFALVFTISSHF